jgi:SAM-dependent methyltransferase
VQGDLEALPVAGGVCDLVWCRDVLSCVGDVGRMLGECARVLRPGGLLVVLVPAWPVLWSDRDERAGHLRRYRGRGLRTLVESAGFTVVEQRGYQFLLLPAIAANRVASSRWGPRVVDREETPPVWLNRLLTSVNTWEAGLARRRWSRPPTGSTLVLVARRQGRP